MCVPVRVCAERASSISMRKGRKYIYSCSVEGVAKKNVRNHIFQPQSIIMVSDDDCEYLVQVSKF